MNYQPEAGRTFIPLSQVPEGAAVSVHPRGDQSHVLYIQVEGRHETVQHGQPLPVQFVTGRVLELVTHVDTDLPVLTPARTQTAPHPRISLSERTTVAVTGLPVEVGNIYEAIDGPYLYPRGPVKLETVLNRLFPNW